MTKSNEGNVLVVHVVVEKHDGYQKFDYGLPIVAFFNRKSALKYKRDRSDRALVIRRLEIH